MTNHNLKLTETALSHLESSNLAEATLHGPIANVEKDHDWKYKMSIVVHATGNKTTNIAIDKKQFEKLKKILG